MTETEKKAVGVIIDCQRILADHLPPDGPDAKATILKLLEILDGPRGLEVAPAHWSDCAVHNMPAKTNGPCDCGGYDPRETAI